MWNLLRQWLEKMRRNRVVITGVGPICSLGLGSSAVVAGLRSGGGSVAQKIFCNDVSIKYYQHQVAMFDLRSFCSNPSLIIELQEWQRGSVDMNLKLMLASTFLGLKDAGVYDDPKVNHNKLGVIVAHENPGLEQLLSKLVNENYKIISKRKTLKYGRYFGNIYELVERSAYETQSFMMLHHISKFNDIHGYSLIINNACASGLYAMEAAAQTIRSGRNDMVVVVASDYPEIYKYLWLKRQGMYSEDGVIKPFARNRSGFVLGEGASSLVFEDYISAKKRGAHILAEYLGAGFRQDAWKVTVPAITESHYSGAMFDAINSSGVPKQGIKFVNAHGVGTRIGDSFEAAAIGKIFVKNSPLVSALKPYVGHTLGASALLESALLIVSMRQGFIPPTINCQDQDDSLSIRILREKVDAPVNSVVMKVATGFAGFHGAVLLRGNFKEK